MPNTAPSHTAPRRLSDKIVEAFEQACDRGETQVAEHLLRALESALTNHGGPATTEKRHDVEPLTSAYTRLEELRARRNIA
jgi:hypothetical protein